VFTGDDIEYFFKKEVVLKPYLGSNNQPICKNGGVLDFACYIALQNAECENIHL
jgi:hypothetical protein